MINKKRVPLGTPWITGLSGIRDTFIVIITNNLKHVNNKGRKTMTRSKVILPKTNPDTLYELTADWLKSLAAAPGYAEAAENNEKLQRFKSIESHFYDIDGGFFVLLIFITLIFLAANPILGCVFVTVFLFVPFGFMAWVWIQEARYEEKVTEYTDNIRDDRRRFMLSADHVFDTGTPSPEWYSNGYYLRKIEQFREWSKLEGVEFSIDRGPTEDEKDDNGRPEYSRSIRIYVSQNGNFIDKTTLDDFMYRTELGDSLTSTPGAIDLSYLDELFWAGYTPYYENEKL